MMDARENAYVLWFDELHRKDVALVGGKSSSLGELTTSTGVPVPYGYATTAHAYRYFMETTGQNKKIHELLRPFRCADRPQTAADPSGHNHNMCFHKIKRFKVRSDGNLHQNKMIVSVNLEKIGDIP